MKRIKTTKKDFTFEFKGYGDYRVVYTSPVTGKSWAIVTNDVELIVNVKDRETPRQCWLESLKQACKNG